MTFESNGGRGNPAPLFAEDGVMEYWNNGFI
jgi:hypothetical protein